jgi:pimeloyl-ACP methyl ester carboxylesterase
VITVSEISVADHAVPTPQGSVFAREWLPQRQQGGPPLILFHDSLGCVAVWRDFPELLSRRTARRVIAYDRLGFGRSEPRSGPLDGSFIADESRTFLPGILKHFGIERFVPFGHSVGGAMALHCGITHAQACAAIITESAQMFVEELTVRSIAAAKAQYDEPDRVDRLRKYHGDKAAWVLRAWTETWLAPDFAAWSVRGVLQNLSCPLLVMHGDRDEFGSLAHPELARALSGGPVETCILENTGHVPHRERPDAVLQPVADFLVAIAPALE